MITHEPIPVFPGTLKKNDALFLYGALHERKPFVYTYIQHNTEIVHGPSCKTPDEIHLANCERDAIPVIERRGGGGTVVLSPGMCITLVVGHKNQRNPLAIFDLIHTEIIVSLSELGIRNIHKRGISDLAINDKKILGSSLYLGTRPPLFYYQSSLMVDSDTRLISEYLKHPPKEPDYRNGRDHDTFCTTLKQEGFNFPVEQIAEHLRNHLGTKLL